MAIITYGNHLTMVSYFKYLVRVLSDLGNRYTEVVSNIQKVKKKWAHLSSFLGQESVDDQTSRNVYLEVAQLLLLFQSEIWVMSPCIRRTLGGFHHRVIFRA